MRAVRNAVTFSAGTLQQDYHIFILGGFGYVLCRAWRVRRAEPARQLVEQLTLAGLGVSPGGFRSESKTVLGKVLKARPSWVKLRHQEASQGFYCPRFIQPNKQTNKQTYLALFIGSWNLQENWRCELFWAGGEVFGQFRRFLAFWNPY